MEIEKILTVAAPPAQVWALLLDPTVMGSCVPGMKSIDVVSDVEYLAEMHVKIAFISARFKIKTTIVETRPPFYLRSEGTGEDASVASSLKQVSEIFLSELPDGQTELRMKIKVDVLGRLGTFGLSVMKTKADRMWDEFGVNLAARLAPADQQPACDDIAPSQEAGAVPTLDMQAPEMASTTAGGDLVRHRPSGIKRSWLSRLFSPAPQVQAAQAEPDWPHVRVDLKRGDTTATVYWPTTDSKACADWLRDYAR
ncbi:MULTISPECIES: CoxG family protein [Polaromonas]|uniref:CoxG family protein n=1 Tax=Polaromonas aquatica TaxID=332657 RepID=A0ABW1U4I4_9BURK